MPRFEKVFKKAKALILKITLRDKVFDFLRPPSIGRDLLKWTSLTPEAFIKLFVEYKSERINLADIRI